MIVPVSVLVPIGDVSGKQNVVAASPELCDATGSPNPLNPEEGFSEPSACVVPAFVSPIFSDPVIKDCLPEPALSLNIVDPIVKEVATNTHCGKIRHGMTSCRSLPVPENSSTTVAHHPLEYQPASSPISKPAVADATHPPHPDAIANSDLPISPVRSLPASPPKTTSAAPTAETASAPDAEHPVSTAIALHPEVAATSSQHTGFVKVEALKPMTNGHTLIVKVVTSKAVVIGGGGKEAPPRNSRPRPRIAECLVGDETGTIIFTARNEQVDIMQPGRTLILRNAKIDMFKGCFMRLALDKWGRVEVSEPANFTVKQDNNLSLVEYELVNVVEE